LLAARGYRQAACEPVLLPEACLRVM